ATVVMWKILQVPYVPHVVTLDFTRLFVHLLFQVFFSTLDMPEEVDKFWKGCQQQHGLAARPNRFAVQTLKSLLCRMQCEDVVMAMERKYGWDTLLCADTHHYAVGLLARVMRSSSIALCSGIALYLLRLLSMEMPCWDLAALAFIVEVLECLDVTKYGTSLLEIISKNLQERVQGEVSPGTQRPCGAWPHESPHGEKGQLLKPCQQRSVPLPTDTGCGPDTLCPVDFNTGAQVGLKEPMLRSFFFFPFIQDDSQVQLCSMNVFQDMMELLMEEERKALKSHMRQSLFPLTFHCHNENLYVTEASWETLHCSSRFLKRRDIKQMLQVDETWNFAECLLAEDRSRAAEHLRQALPYLESPQEPLREAAVRFMGEPGFPPRPAAARPQPRLLPRQLLPSGPAPLSPGCSRGCCRPPAAEPLGGSMRQGPGLSPAGHEGEWPQGWQRRWQGAVPLGRAVTGSVLPGMAGQSLRGQKEELQLIYEGE
ncbi:uncharacterized protein LOC130266983, partial [Oenanthe melanoleuca]|uniref:uncharacterized protein LOC130266983 n=1 Tax=Oenanthe melanoleuca TaxID=2939378 RepID=UPI0024C1A4E9